MNRREFLQLSASAAVGLAGTGSGATAADSGPMVQAALYADLNSHLREFAKTYFEQEIAKIPIFRYFPVRHVNDNMLVWEDKAILVTIPKTNYDPLPGQCQRLPNSPGPEVKFDGNVFVSVGEGSKETTVPLIQKSQPLIFGEFMSIDKNQLAQIAKSSRPAEELASCVLDLAEMLIGRRIDRMQALCWDIVRSGRVTGWGVALVETARLRGDSYVPPRADGEVTDLLLNVNGKSIVAKCDDLMFMNDVTFMKFAKACGYPVDKDWFATARLVGDIRRAKDQCPITVSNGGYMVETGQLMPWLPNSAAVLFKKPQHQIGEYRITQNANNPDLEPGPYTRAAWSGEGEDRELHVYDGHNGSPIAFESDKIVLLDAWWAV